MKNIIVVLILSSTLLFACKTSDQQSKSENEYLFQGEKTEGDLYFSWLRLGNLYGKDISSKEEITARLDTMQTNREDSTLIILYKKLHEIDLMYAPYIEVVMENDVHTTWYLTADDYEMIKKFYISDLKAKAKKVHLTGDIEKIYQNAFKCNKILDIELVDQNGFDMGNGDNYN